MSSKKNLQGSILARLKNIAKEHNVVYSEILSRYAIERFLKRIEQSEYASRCILKGGTLFVLWSEEFNYRPTMDADLEFRGEGNPAALSEMFRGLAQFDTIEDDGIRYDSLSVKARAIREDDDYGGVRVSFLAYIGTVRIPVQFDVGIGDAITPPAKKAIFPPLLDISAPKIKVYPKETVIAEKFETIVKRGLANSRMKDYYDLWLLASDSSLQNETVKMAIRRTFARRGTALPKDIPDGLTQSFANDNQKIMQWRAFLRKNRLAVQDCTFAEVVEKIRRYFSDMGIIP